VAITLLKIELVTNLVWLQKANEEPRIVSLPSELFYMIRKELVSSALANRWTILRCPDHTENIGQMTDQILMLYHKVQRHEPSFWTALINPLMVHEAQSRTQLTLKYSYASWVETPRAIQIIKDVKEIEEDDANLRRP
jgi:hypothetical protein